FLLGQMAAHPDERFDADRARGVFEAVYLGTFRQMERRLAEQTASGNVTPTADGYVITPQGRAFIRFAGVIAGLFRTDTRLIAGASAPAAVPPPSVSLRRERTE
ncbi:MAG: hypothetical protein INR63_10765, partial [Actinomycetospora chiangmaiensis]|nr:hypothetical protein [Actinomycetospora chiangmaiensis]